MVVTTRRKECQKQQSKTMGPGSMNLAGQEPQSPVLYRMQNLYAFRPATCATAAGEPTWHAR